jgi:hypothetical protein
MTSQSGLRTARAVYQKISLPSPSTTAKPIRKMMKMIHKTIFMRGFRPFRRMGFDEVERDAAARPARSVGAQSSCRSEPRSAALADAAR